MLKNIIDIMIVVLIVTIVGISVPEKSIATCTESCNVQWKSDYPCGFSISICVSETGTYIFQYRPDDQSPWYDVPLSEIQPGHCGEDCYEYRGSVTLDCAYIYHWRIMKNDQVNPIFTPSNCNHN
jgi:hypothetical protein